MKFALSRLVIWPRDESKPPRVVTWTASPPAAGTFQTW